MSRLDTRKKKNTPLGCSCLEPLTARFSTRSFGNSLLFLVSRVEKVLEMPCGISER